MQVDSAPYHNSDMEKLMTRTTVIKVPGAGAFWELGNVEYYPKHDGQGTPHPWVEVVGGEVLGLTKIFVENRISKLCDDIG